MNTGDQIEQRGQALEDAFFRRVDEQLMKQLKEQVSSEQGHKALSAACPWANEAMLAELEKANLTSESLVSLSLVPLIRVAWADGRMELNEKTAILKAAAENSCEEGTPGYQILAAWLEESPGDELFEAWKLYVGAVSSRLPADAQRDLKEEVVGRARAVAKSAGGILGIHAISEQEEAVLAEIEAAF